MQGLLGQGQHFPVRRAWPPAQAPSPQLPLGLTPWPGLCWAVPRVCLLPPRVGTISYSGGWGAAGKGPPMETQPSHPLGHTAMLGAQTPTCPSCWGPRLGDRSQTGTHSNPRATRLPRPAPSLFHTHLGFFSYRSSKMLSMKIWKHPEGPASGFPAVVLDHRAALPGRGARTPGSEMGRPHWLTVPQQVPL